RLDLREGCADQRSLKSGVDFCLAEPAHMPMRHFTRKKLQLQPPIRSVEAQVPELRDAELAAVYCGQRVGGDCYDFLRVSPIRVLFILLDVAGRIDENRPIVAAVQNEFRSTGARLFARDAPNEADAMIELCLKLNRNILKTAAGVCSSPAF